MQIRKLTITMKKDLRELIRDFTFSLKKGDKAAIIGEEGNGKSTLLKAIYDEALVKDYVEISGEIQRDSLILGYLSQELPTADKSKTVYEFCCDEDAFLESTASEIARAAAKVQLSAELVYEDREIRTISGGEKVKLRMMLLLLKNPDVLLLDEPSNDIDIQTLEWLESFINSSEAAVIFISHDETLVENTANVILHIEQLRKKTVSRYTVAKMGYRQYIEERLNKFAHQEQIAKKEREDYKKQQERFRQIYQRVDHEQNSISRQDAHGGRLLKKKMKAVKSLEKRLDREHSEITEIPDSEDAIMIKFSERVQVPAGKTVLEFSLPKLSINGEKLAGNINLTVRGAEHICITGRNGIGKTTLLKQIAGELLGKSDIKAAYMPQDYEESMDTEITPVDFLTGGSGDKAEITRAKTFLGSMKYTADECGHRVAELSGGQKAKLFFLKMIIDENNVLILDEPTRNFSPLSNPVIREVLRDFGGVIISVSHDRKYISEICEKVYRLEEDGLRLQTE